MLQPGSPAPLFTLPDQDGCLHSLEEFRGRKVVLYFYPKDNTPGCTKQACGFAERFPQFSMKNVVVLGISKDSVTSHKKFAQKFSLPFTLLADTDLSVIKAYGVWQEKKNYGKTVMGVVRSTFLIDENGVRERVFFGVKATENPQQMLEALT